MELLSLVTLFALGALFFGAAYLAYRKEWKWPASACVLFAFVFFLSAHPILREFVRTTAWATFVTYLEATAKGLADLSKAIDKIRDGIEIQQKGISSQHKKLAEVQTAIQKTQGDLEAALAKLREQQTELDVTQKKLSNTEQLLKSFYESRTTRQQSTKSDGTHFMLIEHEPRKASVYVLLRDDVPIPQTLDLVWRVYSQPKASYWTSSSKQTIFSGRVLADQKQALITVWNAMRWLACLSAMVPFLIGQNSVGQALILQVSRPPVSDTLFDYCTI